MPTMLDVAKRAGVALSTVSYAINGTRPISEETRQRIFAAMEEIGYRPHALARGLASKRSRILALLFPTSERGLGATELEFVASAAEAALDSGYQLVLWPTQTPSADELERSLQQGLVEGVILMEVLLDDERIAWLRRNQLPFSLIGRCADTRGIHYVDIDFAQTAQAVVSHLAALGHTRIAFVNHSQAEFEAGYGPAVRAQEGFERAIQAAELSGVSVFCHASPHLAYAVGSALFAEHPELTALMIMNDRAIPGIIRAIAERGWRIPHDISLVSLVSSPRLAELTTPPLTLAEPPNAELGRLSVELLIQQLETSEQGVTQQVIPCRLVVRGSSGPRRRH